PPRAPWALPAKPRLMPELSVTFWLKVIGAKPAAWLAPGASNRQPAVNRPTVAVDRVRCNVLMNGPRDKVRAGRRLRRGCAVPRCSPRTDRGVRLPSPRIIHGPTAIQAVSCAIGATGKPWQENAASPETCARPARENTAWFKEAGGTLTPWA